VRVKQRLCQSIGRWAIVGTLLAASSVAAHHSGAAYDGSKTLRLQGTVESWRFGNPHSSLVVKAADGAGEALTWSFEANPAGMLTALGYRRNTFVPAAPVTVVYNPMKDGKPGGGRLVGAILSDGSTVGQVPAP
jgi:hypothetical protein